MTAAVFLGLTATPSGVLASWSDGRIAEVLDRDGAVTLRPYAHANYDALWPEPARASAVSTSPGTANNTTDWFCEYRYPRGGRCHALRETGHKFCPLHETPLPTRAD